jgi:L-rhamnose isomerase
MINFLPPKHTKLHEIRIILTDYTHSYGVVLHYFSEADGQNAGGIGTVVVYRGWTRSANELRTLMRKSFQYLLSLL